MKAVSIYIDTSIKGPRRRNGACQLEQEHPYREWLKLELWRRRKEEGF